MDQKPQPLTRHAHPELDRRYPGVNFMTMTVTVSGATRLVATTKSITLQPLYAEMDYLTENLDPTAAVLVVQLQEKKAAARWMGKKYIEAYHTPEEWEAKKTAEKIEAMNTLKKPRRKK